MKKQILLLLVVLLSNEVFCQSDNGRLYAELEEIEVQLHQNDTVGVRQKLRDLEQRCDATEGWRAVMKIKKLYGYLEAVYCKSESRSIPYFQKAYDQFPNDEAADNEFMEIAGYLACAYTIVEQYDKAEKVAAEALVKGACLSDSVSDAFLLFSVLAECYEKRGDTLMAKNFHRRSQMSSILIYASQTQPDSVDRLYDRLYYMYGYLDNQYCIFSKDNPTWLKMMTEYLNWVISSWNIAETIWLGNQILQIAQDSSFEMEPWMMDTYCALLHAYACDRNMDRCNEVLETAKRNYATIVGQPEKDGVLYYYIATGLMDDLRYEEAREYFTMAKERMDKRDLEEYVREIDERMVFCEENNGFGVKKKGS